jgi:SpoVK/Ycf46/Vps4 family AAA+-type ATPase
MPEVNTDIYSDLINLARIALSGRQQDVQLLIHKLSKRYQKQNLDIANALIALLQESPTRASPLRKQVDTPLPVDVDSRLQLLRVENPELEHEPILSKNIEIALAQIVSERKDTKSLLEAGLHPTKSILFTGPPGVGKTMAARWIASRLHRPLLVLDLTAVMSSFLGKTGNNVRYVLDYAKSIECVLLLDEFDSIAKRRDDNAEIGELKRLVTVLLQEVDDWPSSGLLIAATNHPDLLDPAAWRRFELILNFQMPEPEQIKKLTTLLLSPYMKEYRAWTEVLSWALKGRSYSDIEREILLARRSSVVHQIPLDTQLEQILLPNDRLSHAEKVEFAYLLSQSKIISQRRAHEITGIARETIRHYNKNKKSTKKIRKTKAYGKT